MPFLVTNCINFLYTTDLEIGYEHTSYTISDIRDSIEMCVTSALQGVEANSVVNISTQTIAGELYILLIPLLKFSLAGSGSSGILKPRSLRLNFSQNSTTPSVVQCYNTSTDLDTESICEHYTNCKPIRILSHLEKSREDDKVKIVEDRSTAVIFVEIANECNCSILPSKFVSKRISFPAVIVPSVVLVVVTLVGIILFIGVCLVCRSRSRQYKGYVPIE